MGITAVNPLNFKKEEEIHMLAFFIESKTTFTLCEPGGIIEIPPSMFLVNSLLIAVGYKLPRLIFLEILKIRTVRLSE